MSLYGTYDNDDIPTSVLEDAYDERRRARWTCICGGGVGSHFQFCPQGDPAWAKDEPDNEGDDE